MAVFIAASDETSVQNPVGRFTWAGWVASETDWVDWFAPAWQERVLDGPPVIPYLHMTEIRGDTFRKKHGLTWSDGERRCDEAARVIASTGGLYLVTSSVPTTEFNQHLRLRLGKSRRELGVITDEPDYLCFLAYALNVLRYVKSEHPLADKVTFFVENKEKVTDHVRGFHEQMPDLLTHIDRADLIPLLGELLPVDKRRIPVQAADFMAWHIQRLHAKTLDRTDAKRAVSMASRRTYRHDWTVQELVAMAENWEGGSSVS